MVSLQNRMDTSASQSESDSETTGSQINVGGQERQISIAAGAALALLAVTRPISLKSLITAALGGALIHRGMSGHCPIYSKVGVNTKKAPNEEGAHPHDYATKSIHIEESVTVMKSAEELYTFWRNFSNLPKFMEHVKHVTVSDDKHSHWIAKGPIGFNVEWDAEVINDEPNALIAWRTTGEAEVDNAGSVRFLPTPDGLGTEIRVTLDYIPPAGKVGHTVAKLLSSDPGTEIKRDLKKFKQLMEAGEVATNAGGQPRGNCSL